MIDLYVPGDAIRIVDILRRKSVPVNPWPINNGGTVWRKTGDLEILKLFKRPDVQGYLVKEKAYSALTLRQPQGEGY